MTAAGRERVRPVRERREVDDAGDDGGGARDRRPGGKAPVERPRAAVECVEVVVVGAHEDETAPDGGRGVDVAARAEAPEQVSAPRRERVDVAVHRTYVHTT